MEWISQIKWRAAEFLGWFFDQMNSRQGLEWALAIQGKILQLLGGAMTGTQTDPHLQVHLLGVLRAIIAIEASAASPGQTRARESEVPPDKRPRVWDLPSFISTLVLGLTQAWMPAIDAAVRVQPCAIQVARH